MKTPPEERELMIHMATIIAAGLWAGNEAGGRSRATIARIAVAQARAIFAEVNETPHDEGNEW